MKSNEYDMREGVLHEIHAEIDTDIHRAEFGEKYCGHFNFLRDAIKFCYASVLFGVALE